MLVYRQSFGQVACPARDFLPRPEVAREVGFGVTWASRRPIILVA